MNKLSRVGSRRKVNSQLVTTGGPPDLCGRLKRSLQFALRDAYIRYTGSKRFATLPILPATSVASYIGQIVLDSRGKRITQAVEYSHLYFSIQSGDIFIYPG